MSEMRFPAFCGLLLAALACSGCADGGDGLRRVAVSGTISRDGAAIATGSIHMTPATGHSGPAANGAVVDGEFSIPADEGPSPGTYRAMIEYLPPKDEWMRLQAAGQVPQTMWEFDLRIPDEDSFEHDFELK